MPLLNSFEQCLASETFNMWICRPFECFFNCKLRSIKPSVHHSLFSNCFYLISQVIWNGDSFFLLFFSPPKLNFPFCVSSKVKTWVPLVLCYQNLTSGAAVGLSDFHAWIFLGWKAYHTQCLIGQHEQIHWLSFVSSEHLTILYSLCFWNVSQK